MSSINFKDIEGGDDFIPLTLVNTAIDLSHHDTVTNYMGGYDKFTTNGYHNKLITSGGPYDCMMTDWAKECMRNKILQFQFVWCPFTLDLPAWGSLNGGWVGGINGSTLQPNNPGSWGGDSLSYINIPDINSGNTNDVSYFDISEPFNDLYFFIKKYKSNETTYYPVLVHEQLFNAGYSCLLIPKWGDFS